MTEVPATDADDRITIRRASAQDAADLAALHARVTRHAYKDIFPSEVAPPTVARLTSDWRGILSDDTKETYMAADGETLVGLVMWAPECVVRTSGRLHRLYVAPERWSNGLGSALHDLCLAQLREQGFSDAMLWVLEGNARARSWYERRGWSNTSVRKPAYGTTGVDQLAYRRSLSDAVAGKRIAL